MPPPPTSFHSFPLDHCKTLVLSSTIRFSVGGNHGYQAITGKAVSSSRSQLHSSENYIVSQPHRVHSLCIVLKRYVTQGARERDSKIASLDSDGSIKLSELFTNNGHIAKYLKATSLSGSVGQLIGD